MGSSKRSAVDSGSFICRTFFICRRVKLSSLGLSNAQLTEIKKEYQASSFPGLDIPMNQVSEPTICEINYKNRGEDKGSDIFLKTGHFSH